MKTNAEHQSELDEFDLEDELDGLDLEDQLEVLLDRAFSKSAEA
jgi:hypothetical protein